MDDLKIISVIIGTFLIAFATSLLLELKMFQNPVRYILVIVLILVEIYFGFIVFKFVSASKKSRH